MEAGKLKKKLKSIKNNFSNYKIPYGSIDCFGENKKVLHILDNLYIYIYIYNLIGLTEKLLKMMNL